MNPQETCFLFLDYDGTVFINRQIPRENREALEAVQRLGHQLILNTGRTRGGLDFSLAEHQGIHWDGMIFGASDMTYRGMRYHEHAFSVEAVAEWIRYGMRRRYWVRIEGEKRNKRYSFELHPEDFTLQEEQRILEDVQHFIADNPVTKLSIHRVDEADTPPGNQYLIRHAVYSEIFPDGRNKGVAFLDFCEHFQIPKEQCICFGDSLNDLAIFQICPTSVCMKASPDALKECATYCAKGEYGVAEGIRWLFGDKL